MGLTDPKDRAVLLLARMVAEFDRGMREHAFVAGIIKRNKAAKEALALIEEARAIVAEIRKGGNDGAAQG